LNSPVGLISFRSEVPVLGSPVKPKLKGKRHRKSAFSTVEIAGAGLDTPFGALTCDLRVIPCRTGRYGVSSNIVEANLEGKTLLTT